MRIPVLLTLLAALTFHPTPVTGADRPPIVNQKLDFWPARVANTRKWSRFMYGTDEFRPRLIVEHFTGSANQEDAIGYWNSAVDATWVHFIIDEQGRITQLAPLDVVAKHAYGVSPWAIGIEHVGESDGDVMGNRRQRRASYQLTCWLQQHFEIPLKGVIGHGEVTSNPHFSFTRAGWRWIHKTDYEFHTDFSHRTMVKYRDRLQSTC
jgi:N-acetyl-anhydromuramyl-L-alanine amidase AmpD